jgi:uncharacterized peroxidase-related enzyme
VAHIDLGMDEQLNPGIRGLLRYRPETGRPLSELAEVLLRSSTHPMPPGERELIAAYVSGLNACTYCRSAHSAFAAAQLSSDAGAEAATLVDQVLHDLDSAPISEKLRALLRIAAAVRDDGRAVSPELVDAARAEGATDLELHDTVLIAAAFCMYNRYVDGLATFAPDDPQVYATAARRIVDHGYLAAPSASS